MFTSEKLCPSIETPPPQSNLKAIGDIEFSLFNPHKPDYHRLRYNHICIIVGTSYLKVSFV